MISISFCCIGIGHGISLSRDNYFDVNLLFQEFTAAAAGSVGGEGVAIPHVIPRKTSAPRGRLIGWLVGGGGAATALQHRRYAIKHRLRVFRLVTCTLLLPKNKITKNIFLNINNTKMNNL